MKAHLRHIAILLIMLLGAVLTSMANVASNPSQDTARCVVLKMKGNECVQSNHYPEALKYYTAAMEEANRSGNRKVYAECNNNIGLVYAAFYDFERAVFYFKKAEQLAEQNKDERLVSLAAINLVGAYCGNGDPQSAERYLHLLEEHPVSSAEQQEYFVSFHRGLIASGKKQYTQAVSYLRDAQRLIKEYQLDMSPSLWYELGNAYNGWGKLDSAAICYQAAIDLARRDNNFEETSHACKALSEVYRTMNERDSAVKYQTYYISLQDSLFNLNKFNGAKAELFDYENDLIDKHISSLQGWIWILLVIVALAIAVIAIITYLYRQLSQAQRLLVRKNQELISQNETSRQLRANLLSSAAEPSFQEHPVTINPAPEHTNNVDDGPATELPLTREQQMMLADRITQVMDDPEVIADPDFNLSKLAKMVNSNTKYVSAVINDLQNKNFKTLLNESRIRLVCQRLVDEENYGHLTIAAIANTVGYNSMNNFILFFKRIVGMTPSKYRQLALKEQQKDQMD